MVEIAIIHAIDQGDIDQGDGIMNSSIALRHITTAPLMRRVWDLACKMHGTPPSSDQVVSVQVRVRQADTSPTYYADRPGEKQDRHPVKTIGQNLDCYI